jgi:hypothetical protein
LPWTLAKTTVRGACEFGKTNTRCTSLRASPRAAPPESKRPCLPSWESESLLDRPNSTSSFPARRKSSKFLLISLSHGSSGSSVVPATCSAFYVSSHLLRFEVFDNLGPALFITTCARMSHPHRLSSSPSGKRLSKDQAAWHLLISVGGTRR